MTLRKYHAAAAVLAFVLTAGVSAADAPPSSAPPALTPQRQKDIEKLIAQLGSDDFDQREAAQRELCKLGEEAVPVLVKAQAAATDAEVRRRLGEVLAPLQEGIADRQTKELLARAAKGGVDLLVEHLARKGYAGAEDQDAVRKAIAAVVDKADGKNKYPLQFEDKAWPVTRRLLINEAAAEELGQAHIATGRMILRGPFKGEADLCTAVVFVNDDFSLGAGAVNSLIVCDGDVTLPDAERCVIVAGGSIALDRAAHCVLAARGSVKVKGDPAATTIRENETAPLDVVTFFDPSQLGAEASLADGRVRIDKVNDGTPLATVGLRAGDVVTAVDGADVASPNAFRKALRRGLVEGKAVLKVRRGADTIPISVRLPD
jgi:PDZ domain-containing protein